MFCELCGLQLFPKQSVCSRCGVASTRHWLQLMSLVTLAVALACNALVAWYLLPQLNNNHQPQLFFRVWAWLNQKVALYGWAPAALGLLVWDYWVRRGSKMRIRGWLVRKLLSLVLLAAVAPLIPRWIPAGQPSANLLTAIDKHPGLPATLAWGIVALVFGILCLNADSRDALLGQGRVLSLVSLGLLLLVVAMTLVGWSLTYSYPQTIASGG